MASQEVLVALVWTTVMVSYSCSNPHKLQAIILFVFTDAAMQSFAKTVQALHLLTITAVYLFAMHDDHACHSELYV